MYLEEYQELTSKLHDLKLMEQNLIEKMQLTETSNKTQVRSISTISS